MVQWIHRYFMASLRIGRERVGLEFFVLSKNIVTHFYCWNKSIDLHCSLHKKVNFNNFKNAFELPLFIFMSSIILLNGLDVVDALSIYLFIWYDNCLLKFLGFSSSIPVKKKSTRHLFCSSTVLTFSMSYFSFPQW